MKSTVSFVVFNLSWWICALGASRGYPFAGPLVTPLAIWIHLRMEAKNKRRKELMFALSLGALGFFIDTALARFGLFTLFEQAQASPSQFAPPWLVAMWILMVMTFDSLKPLSRIWWLLPLVGAITGPISYFAGESLHIVTYRTPLWLWLGLHAVLWAVLLPALYLSREKLLASKIK